MHADPIGVSANAVVTEAKGEAAVGGAARSQLVGPPGQPPGVLVPAHREFRSAVTGGDLEGDQGGERNFRPANSGGGVGRVDVTQGLVVGAVERAAADRIDGGSGGAPAGTGCGDNLSGGGGVGWARVPAAGERIPCGSKPMAASDDRGPPVVADLQRLRFGARETWSKPEQVFRRAKQTLRAVGRPTAP